jgi:hypothetical protein
MTYLPPTHKNTKLFFYNHLVIINLIQSAKNFSIQILIVKLRIEN